MATAEINFNQKVQCKNCTEDIFSVSPVLIRCAVCPDLNLCLECFACRALLGSHQPTHDYRVIDNGGFPVLSSEWTARDHLRLLDSVEQYGFGNWEDIAKKVSTNPNHTNIGPVPGNIIQLTSNHTQGQASQRSPDETKIEFCNNFIDGPVGQHTWHEEERGRARDHTLGNPLLPPSAPAEPPANLTLTESIMMGYMPKRDDFEVEYDNEAESLVAQLPGGTPGIEEDELDMALKAAHVDMYKVKLRERERRRKVAREHQLISHFFKENPVNAGERRSNVGQKTRKKEKTDLTERLKILAEFQGVAEHQAFVAGIVKERELKAKVKDLMRYRKNGITQLKEGTEFENQRLRRIRRKNELRRKLQQQDSLGVPEPASPALSIKSEDMSNGGSPVMFTGSGAAMSPAAPKEEKLSVLGLPGHEFLSANEKKLCLNLRLTPAHYITYKTCLLTHHLQKKKGQTPKPLNPEGLDKTNRKIIFQFLMRAGWITAY